jgi:hypothetical protein
MKTVFAFVVTLLLGLRFASAEVVTYEARGRADDTAADPRTQALDVAFSAAVTEAVADLAGTAARTKAADVDRDIIKRARRYVASFQVKAQSTDAGSIELDVAVRVDLDKVRAKLGELGVPLQPKDPGAPALTSRGGKTATILLRVLGIGRIAATFGSTADPDVPGVARVSEALAAAGYTVVPASAAGPPPGPDNELPVDDTGARALGADAKATIVVIVGVNVGEMGPVRGIPLRAVPASARLRAVDVATGTVLEDVTIQSGAWGTDERLPRVAAEAAAAAAASAAWAARRGPVVIGGGAPITAPRGVTVRVRGDQAWSAATAIRAQLASMPGIERVTWAGVGGAQVALAVTGATPKMLAGTIKTTSGVAGKVDIDGDVVEVTLP